MRDEYDLEFASVYPAASHSFSQLPELRNGVPYFLTPEITRVRSIPQSGEATEQLSSSVTEGGKNCRKEERTNETNREKYAKPKWKAKMKQIKNTEKL